MSPQLANLALVFLGRVNLTGLEAADFLAVVKGLEQDAAPLLPPAGLGDQPDVDDAGG